MALPVWPAAVPSRAREGWQMPEMFRAPLATEMNGGNQRLRSQPGSNVALINYPLVPLDDEEWTVLDTFFRVDLKNGSSRWTMPLYIGTGTVTRVVQLEGGRSPAPSRSSGYFHLMLPLRVYGM